MLKATATPRADGAPSYKSRARRFQLQLAVRYRPRGESTWRQGETENISGSGVLFWGDFFADRNTAVDLCLRIPGMNLDDPAEMICRGTIVRATPPQGSRARPLLAVKIVNFRLVRL